MLAYSSIFQAHECYNSNWLKFSSKSIHTQNVHYCNGIGLQYYLKLYTELSLGKSNGEPLFKHHSFLDFILNLTMED